MGICKEEVFKKVFLELNPIIQRFGQGKGLDVQKAADLAQDAFVRLWKNCKNVEMDSAKAWLFTTAKNLLIDDYRRVKTQLKLKKNFQLPNSSSDGQYLMEMDEFRNKLEQAIDGMKVGSKEVFMMHRFNNMTYIEIASSLGISTKAVEKRMSLALKHLVEQKIFRKK